jgi:hypothetical protein
MADILPSLKKDLSNLLAHNSNYAISVMEHMVTNLITIETSITVIRGGGWRRLLDSVDCSLCCAVRAAAVILPVLAPASATVNFAVICTTAFAALYVEPATPT